MIRPPLSTLLWLAALACVNLPLLAGHVPERFILYPVAVAAGEWWRLVTHPLAHVSLYHLLLDAGAFLLLWHQLPAGRRIGWTIAAAAGSAGLAALLPGALAHGLCGLSGVAHGLMAAQALEMLRDPAQRRAGAWCLLLVAGKSLIELATGNAFFADVHLGDVGAPVVGAHLGGVLGAVIWGRALTFDISKCQSTTPILARVVNQGMGRPWAACQRANQSWRSSSMVSAAAAVRIRSTRLLPITATGRLGCASTHARASCSSVAPL